MDTVLAAISGTWTWWTTLVAAEQTPPWWVIAIAVIAGGLLATNPAYRYTRHLVTYVHEAGHAVVGMLTGRKLAGIRLHTDSSGVTTTVGTPGFGAVLTAAAGYPAPAITAGLLIAAALSGYAVIAVTIAAILTAVLLLFTRNLWGLVITVTVLAAFLAALRWLPVNLVPVLAAVAAGLLAVGSLRDLIAERRARRTQPTDIISVSESTHLPAALVWGALTVAAVAGIATPMALMAYQTAGRLPG